MRLSRLALAWLLAVGLAWACSTTNEDGGAVSPTGTGGASTGGSAQGEGGESGMAQAGAPSAETSAGHGGSQASAAGGTLGEAGFAGQAGGQGTSEDGPTEPDAKPEALDCSAAEGPFPELGFQLVAEGFSVPTFVTSEPVDASRLYVLEQTGRIKLISDGTVLSEPFLDLWSQVTTSANEQGLLGMAFHPNYEENGRFFVHYSARAGVHGLEEGDTVVSEFTVSSDPERAVVESERVLFSLHQPRTSHNGGMLAFGRDGQLYIGLGDGGIGGGGDPQDLSDLFGTILRIDVDSRDAGEYGVPVGNQTGDGVAPEIWDYGLRNPWRFSVDACTGDLYIGDVGQTEYEEVDVEPFGAGAVNYGWPVLEASTCVNPNRCDATGMVLPVVEYGREAGNCVVGGYVYRGSKIPGLRGTYLYADYVSTTVWSFDYVAGAVANQRVLFESVPLGSGGITSFGQDAVGNLYLVRRGGQILELVAE